MSNRAAIGWLAAVLFCGALVAGFVPVHANDVSCGSAFAGSDSGTLTAQFGDDLSDAYSGRDYNQTDYAADCEDRRGTQRAFVIPMLAVAALAGGFLVLTNSPKDEKASEDQIPRAV